MEAASNRDLAVAIYRGFVSGNFGPLLEALAPTVRWSNHGSPLSPFHGVFRGPEGVRDYLRRFEQVELQRFDVRALLEAGDHVVTLIEIRRRTRETGQLVEGMFVHLLQFANGKLIRVDVFEPTVG